MSEGTAKKGRKEPETPRGRGSKGGGGARHLQALIAGVALGQREALVGLIDVLPRRKGPQKARGQMGGDGSRSGRNREGRREGIGASIKRAEARQQTERGGGGG